LSEVSEVAFVGSRGIPARYGGTEVFVEEISKKLIQIGWKVYVTCESNRFGEDYQDGVVRLHIPSIHGKSFTIPTINDVLATLYLLLKHPKVRLIYYLASDAAVAAVIPKLLQKKIIVNIDGMEWWRLTIRRKYFSLGWRLLGAMTFWYLRFTEWLSVRLSHITIADSREIKAYLGSNYRARNVAFIPYGARVLIEATVSAENQRRVLKNFGLSKEGYYLTVSRVVAENNIETALEGFRLAKSEKKLVIVGISTGKDGYSIYLHRMKGDDPRIMFLNPIWDKQVLGILRKNCYAYIHAYLVGGTNPSLLEQLSFGRPIVAYDVPFHREVLQDGGIYFKDEDGLAECITSLEKGKFDSKAVVEWQVRRIEEEYNWDKVAGEYDSLFRELLART
jgi:rhamnosyltransferase